MGGEDLKGTGPGVGPVMLALSTFRHSEKAIETAVEEAAEVGRLVVVYVADVNLGRYLIGTDLTLYPELKESYEQEVLQKHEERAREHTDQIEARAAERGIAVETHVEVGRFALVCLKIVEEKRPSLILTTRTQRPGWVKRLFGSPVDKLVAEAGCPVVEV